MQKHAEAEPTQLLQAWHAGDEQSQEQLIQLFYPWLNKAATSMMNGERDVSLASADLVHETVIRLIKFERLEWQNRAHFMALASKTMRRVLIDYFRAKRSNKRSHKRVTLMTRLGEQPRVDLQRLNHALLRLSAIDLEKADIVEMRYFGGMTFTDIAIVTDVSEATVKRRWSAARAWLLDAIEAPF